MSRLRVFHNRRYERVVEVVAPEEDEIFDISDGHYLEEWNIERPPDFDLHLAVAMLTKEKVPDELVNPIRQWAREKAVAAANI